MVLLSAILCFLLLPNCACPIVTKIATHFSLTVTGLQPYRRQIQLCWERGVVILVVLDDTWRWRGVHDWNMNAIYNIGSTFGQVEEARFCWERHHKLNWTDQLAEREARKTRKQA